MILQILLFVLLLLVPDIYLWTAYIQPLHSWVFNVLWFLPTIFSLTAFFMARKGVYHNAFLRILFSLVLLMALPKLVFTLLQFVLSVSLSLALVGLLLAFLLYGFFFGWRRIVVRTATCESALLPKSFDGYRILQFSDLHVGTFLRNPKFVEKVVQTINKQQVDLVVFTGDLVNIHAEEVRPFMRSLSSITAPDGIYSVMGNHDYCEYGMEATREKAAEKGSNAETTAQRHQRILAYLEGKMGWRMLMNEHVNIVRLRNENGVNKSESISLIGVENIGKPPFKSFGSLSKAMEGLVDGTFKVLLSHDPTHWRSGVLHKTDIALTLSGHTHAGQVKIGRFSPSRWAYNEWGGKYTEGNSMLYVSLGIGGTMPFRLGAWPEVNVIELRRKD